jgi:NitT/TauT family transport system substrate-binding protein
MKLAVPDVISNSYFPAVAAIELGFFKREGLDVSLELIFPVDKAYAALRDGAVDFVGGSAHSALAAFPEWRGVKLLCAQGQGMYWFLVMHADFKARRGDVSVVKGKSIGAAPWVDMGLRRLLVEAGIDLARDNVTIAPVPGAQGAGVNFGVTAARALEERKIDGFWANGMGAQVAVSRGVGTVVLDVRRGDGPKACFNYTMASVAATDALIARTPDVAAACVRAIVNTQAALRADPNRATEVGKKLFPPSEGLLIAELIRRDLPYYDASISEEFVAGMNGFARDVGILKSNPMYEDVVATTFGRLWTLSGHSVTAQEHRIQLSPRQVMYLKNARFLPQSLLEMVQSAAAAINERHQLTVSLNVAEQFRSAFTDRLAKVGFDASHEPTSEGKVLEELIDQFYCD